MLQVHAGYPCFLSLLHVHAKSDAACRMFVLHVHSACLNCISMLYIHAAWNAARICSIAMHREAAFDKHGTAAWACMEMYYGHAACP
jgi:hypothetical protein